METALKKGKEIVRSLPTQILAVFLVMLLFQSVVLFWVMNRENAAELEYRIDQSLRTYTDSLCRELGSVIEEINRSTKVVLGNEQVQDAIRRRYEQDYTITQEIRDNQTIQTIMFSFMALQDDIQMILVDRDGKICIKAEGAYDGQEDNFLENPYLENHIDVLKNGGYLVIPAQSSGFTDFKGNPAYVFVRALKDIRDGTVIAYLATLFQATPVDQLVESISSGMEGMEVYVYEQERKILASSNQSRIGTVLEETWDLPGKVAEGTLPGGDWHVMLRIADEDWKKQSVGRWGKLSPFLALLFLSGGLVWIIFVYREILRPLNQVNRGMESVTAGDWSVRINRKPNSNEVTALYSGFNEMVSEIDRLTKRNMQDQILFKDAQMEALRYQINPHFLFNTLQTIEAIAEVYDVSEIQMISKSMGDMFRYNIRGFDVVTLEQELAMIQSYLQIEQIRFGEEFTYSIEAEENVRSCRILKFILQPITENCISHGLKGTRQKWVRIHAFLQGGHLVIQVINSGREMDPQQLRDINLLLEKAHRESDVNWISHGVGMLNVHRRLVTRFGPQYGVSIRYSDGRGTCVELTMPYEYLKTGEGRGESFEQNSGGG